MENKLSSFDKKLIERVREFCQEEDIEFTEDVQKCCLFAVDDFREQISVMFTPSIVVESMCNKYD